VRLPQRRYGSAFVRSERDAGTQATARVLLSHTKSTHLAPIVMKHLHSSLEPLEPRIAPAGLIAYTEPDGDVVTVKTSLGDSAGLLSLCTFTTPVNGKKILQKLDLNTFDTTTYDGSDISITVTKRGDFGDGLVAVGAIDAVGIDLGKVTLKGDLGQIDAGDFVRIGPAVKSLVVDSMGAFGTTTQMAGGNLQSVFDGSLGSITVKKSLTDVSLSVTNAGSVFGPAKIGGSATRSGFFSSGNITSVTIGRDLVGDGATIRSTSGNIGSIKIGGNMIGGTLQFAGCINADNGNIGPVFIRGDLEGGTTATTDGNSGTIAAAGSIASVTIMGSFRGTAADFDTVTGIFAGQSIGAVKIGGSYTGDDGNPISIQAFASSTPGSNIAIKSVTIGGDVEYADIAAGYGIALDFRQAMTGNADAQIGPVKIGGDWNRSLIVAGVKFGNAVLGGGDDVAFSGGGSAISRIAAITIKGAVNGFYNASLITGFAAQEVGSLSVNGVKFKLGNLTAAKDSFVIGNSINARLMEIA